MELDVPEGFLWSGVSAGVKNNNQKDLGLAYSSYPATTAGVFTRNVFPAAPVRHARGELRSRAHKRGLVVNSGVANAATGEQGVETNQAVIDAAARRLGLESEDVLASSTGKIGPPLPVDSIGEALPEAVDELEESPHSFAEAILTTDKRTKLTSRTLGKSSLLGVAKGSGMIRPDMATMLAFLFIDHPVEAGFLHESVVQAVETSFNQITVDGEMSTNDTVLVMAANLPDREPIEAGGDRSTEFSRALDEVTGDLARQIVGDGEGATCSCEILIKGAPTDTIAADVADSVANSNLVKTALNARSPYSGRVFSAVGATGHSELDPRRLTIRFNDVEVFADGSTNSVEDGLRERFASLDEFTIEVDLGAGNCSTRRLTCDFSHEYVDINTSV